MIHYLRALLYRWLNVEKIAKEAFYEGWQMHGATSRECSVRKHAMLKSDLDAIIDDTRVWRSCSEAWANSNTEERF